ncbi:type II 3-dehydroquinate dehydratase [Mycolicibacterium sp. HK-90]|uniref:type II 3-dehydroquinate dehydratase n=1 Tax=Mycolicibacterium sp. HK-90 TaxID=3056937 RepID=UPI00265AFDD3|nr:type II 3-dehydroquinate dehydratase [Mycolicibacterium sp. HK-90]WKG03999.1 type II 3-dehydroquinate dehydratase [Mycolicibacterium sp. HK-90]
MSKFGQLRRSDTQWRIAVLSGPNTVPALRSVPDFTDQLESWGQALDVQVRHIQSNHEGQLLELVHSSCADTDGYLVNPGGLTAVGESLRHCLKDAKRPCVEVHWDNAELGEQSIFAPSVTAIFSGLGHFSVLGALTSLVLALDDADFLHPRGTSEFNRAHGTPRSLYQ